MTKYLFLAHRLFNFVKRFVSKRIIWKESWFSTINLSGPALWSIVPNVGKSVRPTNVSQPLGETVRKMELQESGSDGKPLIPSEAAPPSLHVNIEYYPENICVFPFSQFPGLETRHFQKTCISESWFSFQHAMFSVQKKFISGSTATQPPKCASYSIVSDCRRYEKTVRRFLEKTVRISNCFFDLIFHPASGGWSTRNQTQRVNSTEFNRNRLKKNQFR